MLGGRADRVRQDGEPHLDHALHDDARRAKVAAERLYAVLSKPPKMEAPAMPEGQPVESPGSGKYTSNTSTGRHTRWCSNRKARGWWARTAASSPRAT